MPSLPTWVASAKRQTTLPSLINTPSTGVLTPVLSDSASITGCIYVSTLHSEPEPDGEPNGSSQTSPVSVTASLPQVSAARNLMQRKLSGASNTRRWSRDVSDTGTNTENHATRLKEENLALASQLDDLRSQLTVCKQDFSSFKLDAARTTSEKDGLARQLDDLRSQLAIREQDFSTSKLDAARMTKENDGLARQLDDVRSQLTVCEQDLSASKLDATRIADENEALRDEVKVLRTELENSKTRFEHVEGENNTLRRGVDGMKTEVEELSNDLSKLNKKVDDLLKRGLSFGIN
jgi:chromosome segregation ATPase